MIDASALAAQIGYQLATDAMILSGAEQEGLQSHADLESMRELSGNGQGIARSVMDSFRDIKLQIYKVHDPLEISVTKVNLFVFLNRFQRRRRIAQ